MTRLAPRSDLYRYAFRHSGPLAPPPYEFRSVRGYTFTLPVAQPKLLMAYIDDVLNRVDDTKVYAPANNVVMLDVLEYDEMTCKHEWRGTGSPIDARAGEEYAVAIQHELVLRVRLKEATSRASPPTRDVEFAAMILVDNPLSVTMGREVLGYPKFLGAFGFDPDKGGKPATWSWMGGTLHAAEERVLVSTQVCDPAGRDDPAVRAPQLHFHNVFEFNFDKTFSELGPDLQRKEWPLSLPTMTDVAINQSALHLAPYSFVTVRRWLDPYPVPSDGGHRESGSRRKAERIEGRVNVGNAFVGEGQRDVSIKIHRYPRFDFAWDLGLVTEADGVKSPITIEAKKGKWFRTRTDFGVSVTG
jgi:hypothetical protein